MLIDFCNFGLVSEITSSVGVCDGYSVHNLIQEKDSVNQKGFLVDYFIKPPVTITIQFHCKISLNHIVIWPKVGAQKSVGIEVFTSYDKTDEISHSVGIAYIKNDENGFLFHKYGDDITKTYKDNEFCMQTFKSGRYLKTECISIKIVRTLGSSVPAMKRLEIWGVVCPECPSLIKTKIFNTWSKIKSNKTGVIKKRLTSPEKATRQSNSLTNNLQSKQDFQIPEEFLDPITFELMILPMTLPCGKIIDYSTLEKFNKEEEKWGRSPSDPFTGKMFTEINKPKPCSALKVRIDKYLIDNSNVRMLQTMPRILGNNSNEPKASCLISDSKNTCVDASEVDSPSSRKRRRDDTTRSDIQFKMFQNKDNTTGDVGGPSKISLTSKTFTELKEQSLNSILCQTLASLPSFQNKIDKTKPTVSCSKCAVMSNLYVLPCKHYLCRLCLSKIVASNSLKCEQCRSAFSTNDPHRIHNGALVS